MDLEYSKFDNNESETRESKSIGLSSFVFSRKQFWILGGTAFTTMTTVLVICLVLLVFTESIPGADAVSDKDKPISFHLLDTSRGKNAGNVYVELFKNSSTGWILIGEDTSGSDGRNTIAIYPAGVPVC